MKMASDHSIGAPLSVFGHQETAEMRAATTFYEQAYEAALAGQPCPEGPPVAVQGWQSGNAKRRILAGEAIGFVCQGTKCDACGEQNWGYRAGCRCNTDLDKVTIRWGLLVDDGLKPGEVAKFMTSDEVRATGKPLIDTFTGADVSPGAKGL